MKNDVIDMQSYDSGYAAGYLAGREDGFEIGYEKCRMKKRREILSDRLEKLYFTKQRAAGAVVLVISAVSIVVLNGDATFALIGVPLGGAMLLGKQKFFEEELG